MIETVYVLVGVGILAMLLVAGLLAKRPVRAPVTVRIRTSNKK